MNCKIISFLLLLFSIGILVAQTPAPPPAGEPVVADSIAQQRNLEILEEYGIRETSTLLEVAEILQVSNLEKLKELLGLEPDNKVLNNRSLRQLSVRPYDAFLASQTLEYGFSELSTLSEVATHYQIPLKKLKSMLGEPLDPLSKKDNQRSLQSLGIEPDRIRQLAQDYEQNLIPYGVSLTLVGMLVVFSALLITSLVIGQMIHLSSHKKKEIPVIKVSFTGKVTKIPAKTSHDVVVAAITALYIYEYTIKERRRIQLTFNRNRANNWRSSSILNMPNREFSHKRS